MRDAAVKARRGGAHRSTSVRWWQVVSAVVPVTLVASAWGVALTAGPADPVDATAGNRAKDSGAPVVTDVPTDVFERPTARKVKSRQSRAAALAGFDKANATPASLRSSPLPSAAIDAYRDAAKVMSEVKASCNLDWTLIAAIGRVESNHGQYGGSTVTSAGDTRPKIIGIPLDGTNNTAAIRDTDNGRLDGDTAWDRAVGPMQFIPSTWDLVAVDGNNDGQRDPSNVYDAALATAVYLCADGEDVSTEAGASSAVYSYNHSNDYVATVLAIAEEYGEGNFTEEPSIYLPDTDPDGDIFNPDAGTSDSDTDGAGDPKGNTKGDTGAGPKHADKVDRTHFGEPKAGGGGPEQIQPMNKHKTSPHVGGGAVVDPIMPDKNSDLLDQETVETAPQSGDPAAPDGQSGPGKIHGFADNHSSKPKHKSDPKHKAKPKHKANDDRLQSFTHRDDSGAATGGGVNVRPDRTESTTPKNSSKGSKENSGTSSAEPKRGGATTESKPKETRSGTNSRSGTASKPQPKKQSSTKTKPNPKPKSDKQPSGSAKSGSAKKGRKHRKLGSITNSAERTELCTRGTEDRRAEGTDLSDGPAERLIATCVDNFAAVISINSDDPIHHWLTTNSDEL